jgi:hypothetical protein
MRLSSVVTGIGAISIIWFFGGFDFAPKLWADLGNWEGADTINRFGAIGLRTITNQWKNKVGSLDAKPLPTETAKKLGDDFCMINTTNPDARLSKKDYDKHVEAINLKVRSPLQSPNSSVYCFDKNNHTGIIYQTEWIPNKFLRIDAATGGETIVDVTPKKDAVNR